MRMCSLIANSIPCGTGEEVRHAVAILICSYRSDDYLISKLSVPTIFESDWTKFCD